MVRCHERDYFRLFLYLLLNFDWLVHLVECPSISTTNCNLQKRLYCVSSLGMYINLLDIVLSLYIPENRSAPFLNVFKCADTLQMIELVCFSVWFWSFNNDLFPYLCQVQGPHVTAGRYLLAKMDILARIILPVHSSSCVLISSLLLYWLQNGYKLWVDIMPREKLSSI